MLLKQTASEFIGTFALVFIGIGAIYNNANGAGVGLLGVALAHGLTIAVMVTAVGGICGGQLNPAVTFGLWAGGQMNWRRSILYLLAQLLGATVASLLLVWLLEDGSRTGQTIVAAGTPALAPQISKVKGLAIEAVLTFFLVFVVYGSAVDTRAPRLGGLAIGLTVAAGILFAGPLTGAALNPARSFGPALASEHWENHLIYWLGPMFGGGVAGVIYGRFLIHPGPEKSEGE